MKKQLKNYQKNQFNKMLKNFASLNGGPFEKNNNGKIEETMVLKDDLGFDSLDNIEFIIEVEKHFDIVIPDEKAKNIKTVKDAYNVLASYL